MYSIKIASSPGGSRATAEAAEPAAGEGSGGSTSGAAAGEEQPEAIQFSAGNPRVEHIAGLVHIYRKLPARNEGSEPPTPGALPEERGVRLCVMALPEDISVAEFCQFVGAHLPKVREMRFVRREAASPVLQPAMILLRFEEQADADAFFLEYNRKPFCSLEPEVVCKLLFVRDLEVVSGAEYEYAPPPPGQTELPTCPVCLERLDEHISGVITTVCNHRFHNECLQQWSDSSCPVCRYVQQPGTSNSCVTCGTRDNLWICLICGHVGCGRYAEAHAADHFSESGHCYSLELETQRVWDYVGDGYVHRLIRSHVDGKIVEVPSPAPGGAHADECGGCAHGDDYCGDMEEAQLASKLDAIAQEYNHLLASQLDSQRKYFEGLMATATREAEDKAAACAADAAGAAASAMAATTDAKQAMNRARDLKKKLEAAEAREAKLLEEKEFLRSLNDSLISNQKEWQKKVAGQDASCQAKDSRIKDLEEQLHDMMMYIEAQQTVAQAAGGEQLAGGTLLPVPVEEAKGRRRGKGKGAAR